MAAETRAAGSMTSMGKQSAVLIAGKIPGSSAIIASAMGVADGRDERHTISAL
jgi:hypothetical protein